MLIMVSSAAGRGIEPILIKVEVNVANRGFPGFEIVGLPNKAVAESKERVKTAIINSGFTFPNRKITVNLAPADIPKEGSVYDLPIAVGLLSAIEGFKVLPQDMYYGELSLEGSLRQTKGVLSAAILAAREGFDRIFIPAANYAEAGLVEKIEAVGVGDLHQLIRYLGKGINDGLLVGTGCKSSLSKQSAERKWEVDLDDIVGQDYAKRALEISAAGGHNLLMTGPPGAGKTMLAKALRGILPPLDQAECLEVTQIYSSAGLLGPSQPLIRERPFRSPHHTTSFAGMVGGGVSLRPGEISLAHRGVLFLDELPEFNRQVLESLRQPLEEKSVTIVRTIGTVNYPASFILVAARNPCLCGNYGDESCMCNCTQYQINSYNKKVSGPILDRIDINVTVGKVQIRDISCHEYKRTGFRLSEDAAKRVLEARERQRERDCYGRIYLNTELEGKHLDKYCFLEAGSRHLLELAVEKFNLSMRAYHKTIRLARTIADLEGDERIRQEHLAEALQYRIGGQ